MILLYSLLETLLLFLDLFIQSLFRLWDDFRRPLVIQLRIYH